MQALDLLLQNFISENKNMDEMCFLLQVRGGVAQGAELRAPTAHLDPGLGVSKVHSGWVPRTQEWQEGQVGRCAPCR